MADRDKIVEFCNDYLKVKEIHDYGRNSMQVEGKPEVNKIALGVSANLELFEKAAEWGADMVIVHHGLFWQKDTINQKTGDFDFSITDLMKKRVETLMKNGMSMLAYHHSLDMHPVIGNQAQFFLKASLRYKGDFGSYNKQKFGLYGDTKIMREELIKRINDVFGTNARVYGDGPEEIKRIGFVSGYGIFALEEAADLGCDTFVTGSADESDISLAKEAKINLILPGHYNSEKLGIQALGELVKNKFRIEVRFIDVPCEV